MVQAVRAGRSQQQVARDFGVSPATVNRWVRHAHGRRLDRVDWSDRAPLPHTTQRTAAALEDLVLELRRQLRSESDLGFFGAEAILAALQARGVEPLPAARTVYRILRRRGALDGSHRVRRPPPPPGWYVPEVARRLGVSVRTLQRRLLSEGLTYARVVDRVRRETAVRLVTSTTLPLADVREKVGFADERAFRRAFRRWTGSSPAELRREP